MRRLIAGVLVVAAGGVAVASSVSGDRSGEQLAVDTQPAIVIPLSLYVVETSDERLSSQRSTDGVLAISERIGEIWAPAGIVFDPIEVIQLDMPIDVVLGIALGDTQPFFEQVETEFDVPRPGLLNGFYVRNAGGVNGFTQAGSRVFFVDDNPTVHDERVSSHEVGHILGLSHDLQDPSRLMFSGTNGMTLTLDERSTARRTAVELLDAVR